MQETTPEVIEFIDRIRSSFDRQAFMKVLGAKLIAVRPGEVEIELPFSRDLTQQHGYVHAGVITCIMDNACGYAANSLMPPGSEVLTVEYKANFLSPACGDKFVAAGKVIRHGRTLTVCSGKVSAHANGKEKLIAAMQATMIAVEDKDP